MCIKILEVKLYMYLTNNTYFCTYQAGGIAGTSVDVALFPLDTFKTRLQSAQGFWKAGGFHGVYSGLGSAALGSAPTGIKFSMYTYQILLYLGPRFTKLLENLRISLVFMSMCVHVFKKGNTLCQVCNFCMHDGCKRQVPRSKVEVTAKE